MLLVGVDIGGTFTDVVCTDGRRTAVFKVPSRRDAPGEAIIAGMRRAVAMLGASVGQVERLIHGTTVATNAIVQRKGAVVGLLTTEGFVDVLEIGRLRRSKLYDWMIDAETPSFLAPRERRFGIPGRIDSEGIETAPLDADRVVAAIRELQERFGVESIAVCYLFAYLNAEHEQRTRAIIEKVAPGLPVSLSSEVNSEYREYERTAVTAFDAYLRPVVERYMARLRGDLAANNFHASLQVMQSRGGITSADIAAGSPVNMVISGPAGGVAAARYVAETTGTPNLITFDMGGTSSDVSLVIEGRPSITTEGSIGGYPVRVGMVDVSTIGAGGGSIAWIDSAGRLRVGPHSAGAEPGPVCYGRGGEQLTVTDASLLLGYLNPADFAMGQITPDRTAAEWKLAEFGRTIGLEPMAVALGIHRVINAAMADQIRLMTVQRGHDIRRFQLLAFGGAGPVHAAALAADLGIPAVLVPPVPGVLAALGLLTANIEHDQKLTYLRRVQDVDPEDLTRVYERLEEACHDRMARDGIARESCRVQRSADLRYRGQSAEMEVPIPGGLDTEGLRRAVHEFHERHRQVYGYVKADKEVDFVNAKVVATYALPVPGFRFEGTDSRPTGAPYQHRDAYFSVGTVKTPVYRRSELIEGRRVSGPAIIEQADTTIVVYPGQSIDVDSFGNVVIRTGTGEDGRRAERPSRTAAFAS